MDELQPYDHADYEGGGMVPHGDGEWVRLDDAQERIATLEAELENAVLKARIDIDERDTELEALRAAVKGLGQGIWHRVEKLQKELAYERMTPIERKAALAVKDALTEAQSNG